VPGSKPVNIVHNPQLSCTLTLLEDLRSTVQTTSAIVLHWLGLDALCKRLCISRILSFSFGALPLTGCCSSPGSSFMLGGCSDACKRTKITLSQGTNSYDGCSVIQVL